jgi:putative FmdB family regulatory protein
MPIYNLVCEKCGNKIEFFGKFEESNNIKCNKCENLMSREVVPTSFQLQGTGWYKTDFK